MSLAVCVVNDHIFETQMRMEPHEVEVGNPTLVYDENYDDNGNEISKCYNFVIPVSLKSVPMQALWEVLRDEPVGTQFIVFWRATQPQMDPGSL